MATPAPIELVVTRDMQPAFVLFWVGTTARPAGRPLHVVNSPARTPTCVLVCVPTAH
jgi:hypothetical protein